MRDEQLFEELDVPVIERDHGSDGDLALRAGHVDERHGDLAIAVLRGNAQALGRFFHQVVVAERRPHRRSVVRLYGTDQNSGPLLQAARVD